VSFSYLFNEKLNLIVVQLVGDISYSVEIAALNTVFSDSRIRPNVKILVERTKATIKTTPNDVVPFVDLIFERIKDLGKPQVANVVSHDVDFGMARMLEMLSEVKLPHDFMVFRDIEEACSWLDIDLPQIEWPKI
jgi:hypothetical protein